MELLLALIGIITILWWLQHHEDYASPRRMRSKEYSNSVIKHALQHTKLAIPLSVGIVTTAKTLEHKRVRLPNLRKLLTSGTTVRAWEPIESEEEQIELVKLSDIAIHLIDNPTPTVIKLHKMLWEL